MSFALGSVLPTRRLSAVCVLTLGLLSGMQNSRAADVAAPGPAPEVEITFVNQGGIVDWEVAGDHHLLLRGRGGVWYLVKLGGPPIYNQQPNGVSFLVGPDDTLDRMSLVAMSGMRYPVLSITRAAAPERKKPASQPASSASP